MQKCILKSNKRFQILNVLTDLVDVFRPKIFEPVKLRVLTRKKKPAPGVSRPQDSKTITGLIVYVII